MSATIPLIATLGLQFVAGYATLSAMRVDLPRSASIPLALLVGMFTHNILFFVCALLNVPLNVTTMMASGLVAVALPHFRLDYVRNGYGRLFARAQWTLTMYDVVVLGVVGYVVFIAVWASWYWPVTPFDAMAGIDLVARQTVEESTIVNRVFSDPSLAGHLSNQPFYAPFAMLLQVMYRLMGFAYGQVWVSIVAFTFALFLWAILRRIVHPFIADILWVLYVLTPEMLGYSYLLQTDFLNAVFFAGAALLVWQGIERREKALLMTSVLMLSAACWSRTESILLVALAVAATLPFVARAWTWRTAIGYAGVAAGVTLATFAAWHIVFFNYYLPVHPSTAEQLIGFDLQRFFTVVSHTFSNVIADSGLWAASFVLFGAVFLLNAVATRNVKPLVPLVWICSVFIGLWIVGTIFSAAIVEQTLRRGIFKVIPLLFVYVAGTEIIQRASRRLTQWEAGR